MPHHDAQFIGAKRDARLPHHEQGDISAHGQIEAQRL
jgi:hypothetical protein